MTVARLSLRFGRRMLLASLPALLALPARANIGSGLITGAVRRFERTEPPKPLPDVAFIGGDDTPLTLTDYKGKVVLVNFWATWCAPCVSEMPSLDQLQKKMGKDRFVVLPLSLDGPTRAKVAPFYQNKKLAHLGIFFDKGRKAMQALGVSVLPTSILIDATGRELGRIEGEADWSAPEAFALMKAAEG
ncbi:TlpA disulfide reductase family protein [Reyranella sp.]|jgi:thiol-disulfide isomerase/thioredoxin|uniref:TlpA disulfide reductase family protein n=1 Tax=Reyranella sp. TaxID=1929291 RepID=UPI002F956A6A